MVHATSVASGLNRGYLRGAILVPSQMPVTRGFQKFAILLLLALRPHHGSGQSRCSVDERLQAATVTGRFSAGPVSVSLTLPRFARRSAPLVLFLETSGPAGEGQEQLFLRVGGQSVAVRDGVPVHVVYRANERLVFTLATRDGRDLCSWEPTILFAKKKYPDPRGLAEINERIFPVTGDPVYLLFGHEFSDGNRAVRIGGVPAPVLAETPYEMIVRDPLPLAGIRTVESEGVIETLRFIDLNMRLQPVSRGRDILHVHVSGMVLRHNGGLYMFSFSPMPPKVACGKAHSFGDRANAVSVGLRPGALRNGEFEVACEIKSGETADWKAFVVQVVEEPR
jgi:hypothetical protein